MRISVNTETEELEELRHAVAIIEDAIKRRENPDLYEEDYEQGQEAEEKLEKKEEEIEKPSQEITAQQQQQQQSLTAETHDVEEQKPHVELNLAKPVSYSQIEQSHQVQKPKPLLSNKEDRGNMPDIDISALSMSNYGEAREGRKLNNISSFPNQPSQPSLKSSPSSFSSAPQSPAKFETKNNESHVKEIINSLRNQRPGQPIQMSEIVSRARVRNISEQETRNLVSKMQREGAI